MSFLMLDTLSVVDRVALRHVRLRELRFSLVGISAVLVIHILFT